MYVHTQQTKFNCCKMQRMFRGNSLQNILPGCVAQSEGHLTHKSEVLGLIPGLATYFHVSFR